MKDKILNHYHNRLNEVDQFIYMIDKFKLPNQSNEDFLNLLEIISENNLKKYSEEEQTTASKMIIVFNELI